MDKLIEILFRLKDHFIRVGFSDENRLRYRWDRATDGEIFTYERVGETLKNGFDLGGRHFEFLAYSNSALKEHSVWFMSPFYDSSKSCVVTAEDIRKSIGDFKGQILRQPSKYAARLGQAFTSTDSAVEIHGTEWEEVPDIQNGRYVFTDGFGSISESLGDKIWNALGRNYGVKPSAVRSFICFLPQSLISFKSIKSVFKLWLLTRNLIKAKFTCALERP